MSLYDNGTTSLSVVETLDTTIMDASVIEGNYGSTDWWAYTACSVTANYGGSDPRRWCRPQLVVYNKTHPGNWDGSTNGRKAVACHEVGHTLGLRHTYATSCMKAATTTNTTPTSGEYNELESWYAPPGGP